MGEWGDRNEEAILRWDQNADFWDEKMGAESNRFHREIVRPATERLLCVCDGEKVLDIACGNGNFSRRLAELGARVTAIDCSARMIENARKRSNRLEQDIDFRVVDATQYDKLMELGRGCFDKAVANMALMDIPEISPVFRATYELLKPGGVFVFSVMHPCFNTPKDKRMIVETEYMENREVIRKSVQISSYITPISYEGMALKNQPVTQFYYHRPLSALLQDCFDAGFVLNGMAEPVFAPESSQRFEWDEIPPALIVRLAKQPLSLG